MVTICRLRDLLGLEDAAVDKDDAECGWVILLPTLPAVHTFPSLANRTTLAGRDELGVAVSSRAGSDDSAVCKRDLEGAGVVFCRFWSSAASAMYSRRRLAFSSAAFFNRAVRVRPLVRPEKMEDCVDLVSVSFLDFTSSLPPPLPDGSRDVVCLVESRVAVEAAVTLSRVEASCCCCCCCCCVSLLSAVSCFAGRRPCPCRCRCRRRRCVGKEWEL
mmetsp:Transcript_11056/g.24752  ORF Transcript_11056/g.24752 Transcript_11056/m.24752 type:complete len:217 (-) Transcript_11056:368-1018(-)